MTRKEAVEIIDNTKNKLINPVEMLNLTWIRVILNNLSDEAWNNALNESLPTLSR